jgi:hypothetical protein
MTATENLDALASAEKHAGRIRAYVRDRNGSRFVGSVRAFDKQPPPETTCLFRLPVKLTWSYGTVVRILFVSEVHASRFPGFIPA